MDLENINVVGKDSETIINHVFDCHEEIRWLKKELEATKIIYTKTGLEMQEINRKQTETIARLYKKINLAIGTIEGLAGQQAMDDSWYEQPLKELEEEASIK